MIVYFNGKLVPEKKAAVSIHDHGFLYGDGVYETLRVYGGEPFRVKEHLRRLKNSMDGIRLRPRWSLAAIEKAIRRTIRANGHAEAIVRLTITRGPGPYGFNPTPCKNPTIVISSMPFRPYPAHFFTTGAVLAVVSIRRNSPDSLPPSVKSTNCLNGILAKIESLDRGADEALMLSHQNTITEATVCNLFLVKRGALFTPKLEGNLLPGVTRQAVCELARTSGLRVVEKSLRIGDLISADEAFLTSTIMEIAPVGKILLPEGKRPSSIAKRPGPVTRLLMSRFKSNLVHSRVPKNPSEREK